ncbi:hypothetical protein FA95DRAFT_1552573 [Auriscalpium vulgare]|uniref:Uncharacterized protein n=1 Tax=Auriscalpium vulgare TaxID=40419 RepID=A0ACB8SBC3_9AGAM|nr:hypothetical protein FA95DRAFT_1552573 [Auriscalpium vulgare]
MSPKKHATTPELPLPDLPLPTDDDDTSEMTADESDGFSEPVPVPQRRASLSGDAELSQRQPVAREPSHSTSWTDLDLSVVVALAAPVGNWLTGNDHLKNLFLVLLLIVYLHQLIQVPWELYHAARTRRPHSSFRVHTPSPEDDTVIKHQTRLALTELRRHELVYLLVAVASPFVGAMLLRYVLSALSGVDSISWFSTALFVLATGIRPWSHLIARLRERTALLHDTVHYPSPAAQLIADSRMQAVLDRVQRLETELAEVKGALAPQARVDDMYDELNGGLDDIERAQRKQERRAESTRVSHETRILAVEKGVARALERKRSERVAFGSVAPPSLFLHILYSLWSILTLNFLFHPTTTSNGGQRLSPKASLHHMKSPNRLETIPEDAKETHGPAASDSDSGSEMDNEVPDSQPEIQGTVRPRPPRRRAHGKRRSLVDLTSDIVAMPYRIAVGVLVAISPPVQRLFN